MFDSFPDEFFGFISLWIWKWTICFLGFNPLVGLNGTLFDTGVDVTNFEGDVSGTVSGLTGVTVSGLIEFIEELFVFSKVVSGSVMF